MAKKSFWDDDGSKYGTYEGPRGNASEWASAFSDAWNNSECVEIIEGTSPHQILGIERNATLTEIKTAYRNLARIHHPDKGGDAAQFHIITNAYKKLKSHRETKTRTVRQTETEPDDIDIIIPQLLTPIEESELEFYLNNSNFGCQEKKDGRHLTIQKIENSVFVRNKKGKRSVSYDHAISSSLPNNDILLDGEIIGDHFYTWDILSLDGNNLRTMTYRQRYNLLHSIHFGNHITKLGMVIENKQQFFDALKNENKEGIVFKNLNAPFTAGKTMDQLKFKFYAEASVIVAPGRPGKASIGMELYNYYGIKEFVGYCSCALHPLPSPGTIAEVRYLYAYRGGKLYQTTFKEIRDDVNPMECTTDQLKYKPGT